MKRGGYFLAVAAVPLALAACGGSEGKLTIRSLPAAVAPGKQPVPYRVAEARAYLRLGNVALAQESYRKALREDPNSVDALNGLAACYDRMGRFDLSRRYYEQALAIAPADSRLYANLALSLDLQGRRAEAAAVRREMQQRLAASIPPQPVTESPAPAPAAPPASTVPVAVAAVQPPAAAPPAVIPASRPVAPPAAVVPPPASVGADAAPSPIAAPAEAGPADLPLAGEAAVATAGPRLERLSLAEVVLVTTDRPVWQGRVVERSSRSATIAFTRLQRPAASVQPVLLLNAARIDGLAARTRSHLAQQGWRRLAIGNARRVQSASLILYPAGRAAAADQLARQLGVPVRRQSWQRSQIVVLLGRNSIARAETRANRA